MNIRKRTPAITVEAMPMAISEEDMVKHCIARELPEYQEDYDIQYVDGLHIVVYGTVTIGGINYHVIDVEPEFDGVDDIYLLSLIEAEPES
jgi:hypothetical protein